MKVTRIPALGLTFSVNVDKTNYSKFIYDFGSTLFRQMDTAWLQFTNVCNKLECLSIVRLFQASIKFVGRLRPHLQTQN